MREANPEALLTELTAGRVDLIVGRLTGRAPDGVHRRKLYDESIRIAVGTHHPLTGRPRPTLQDLCDFPWILPTVETALRQELETFFARQGVEIPGNQVEATSFLTVRQLLRETDMVAVLPGLIVGSDPQLAALPFSLEPLGHSVGLTLPAHRQLNPATRALEEALQAAAEDLRQEPDVG
ncbi:LysR substrate-binding domain-containing protein [Streptomyces sp. GD-15H]|uniref:LysR substrate-binding domain-containing protein n=1 Tax=Streptomyces sp. GD-15H TaxID=3129112 RepID=UPI0032461CD1